MKLDIELAPQHKSGLRLRNPVMLASGMTGYGLEIARVAEIHRLGALVCNSVFLHARVLAEPPRLLETPAGLLSSFARPGQGLQKVLKTYARTWATWQTPVIVSLAGTTRREFVELAARLDGLPGVAALELNLACSNLDTAGAIFGADTLAVERLVTDVRQATTLPLLAKLAPYDGELLPIALAAAAAGVDALSLIHTLPALSIDIYARRPALYGGLSGPAIRPLALRYVYDLARELRMTHPLIPLVGIGGIATAEDALSFLMAGASAIQAGSINYVNPRAGVEIVAGIETFLQHTGVTDISEIIGAALPA